MDKTEIDITFLIFVIDWSEWFGIGKLSVESDLFSIIVDIWDGILNFSCLWTVDINFFASSISSVVTPWVDLLTDRTCRALSFLWLSDSILLIGAKMTVDLNVIFFYSYTELNADLLWFRVTFFICDCFWFINIWFRILFNIGIYQW